MALSFSSAKNITIVQYLPSLGSELDRVRGNNYWYHSPSRLDKDPSFKVDIKKTFGCTPTE